MVGENGLGQCRRKSRVFGGRLRRTGSWRGGIGRVRRVSGHKAGGRAGRLPIEQGERLASLCREVC